MTPPAIANGTVAAIAVPPVARPTPIPTSAPPAPPAAVAANGVARLAASELSNARLHLGQVICAMRLLLYWLVTTRRRCGEGSSFAAAFACRSRSRPASRQAGAATALAQATRRCEPANGERTGDTPIGHPVARNVIPSDSSVHAPP
jgi:hypothetical protein